MLCTLTVEDDGRVIRCLFSFEETKWLLRSDDFDRLLASYSNLFEYCFARDKTDDLESGVDR